MARLSLPPVLIFHQGLLNSEEGPLPPTSPQTNCLRDCRGGSEADGWLHKDPMRPYLQTLNPYLNNTRAAASSATVMSTAIWLENLLPPPLHPSPRFTRITSLSSNYIHSAPSLPPPPLSPADPDIHLSISAPSCGPSTSVPLPLCPLGLTRTHVFIHISILSGLPANQRVAPPLRCCQPACRCVAISSSSTSSPFLLSRHMLFLALPEASAVPLPPSRRSSPVGSCLRFPVNLPENALAVMKAEGRGNPPGFH